MSYNRNTRRKTSTAEAAAMAMEAADVAADVEAIDAADNDDWPAEDTANRFPYIPYNNRTRYLQGFGPEPVHQNLLDPYPSAPHMRLTAIDNKDALYSNGNIEFNEDTGIASHIINGDTDNMRVPIMTGDSFDTMRDSSYDAKYRRMGTPYTPLSMQERQQVLDRVTGGSRRRARRTTTRMRRNSSTKNRRKPRARNNRGTNTKNKKNKKNKKSTHKRRM